ncbi:YbiU family protein [Escherichia coli]
MVNPDVSVIYPTGSAAVRRNDLQGLGAHTDSGALERGASSVSARFRHVFNGNLAQDHPCTWHIYGSRRVHGGQHHQMSVFWTFQGCTALSDMLPCQGPLHVVSIPEAMATYCYVRWSMMCRRMNCAA